MLAKLVEQKKHEILVDSLPYIDKEFDDDSMKDVIERLIADEMEVFEPDDYLSMLPPVPALKLPEGSVLKSEFDRLAKAPSSRMPQIDMTRYTIPVPQGKDAENLECWQEALKVAHKQQEYAAIRLANVELMTNYGVNAWRAYNSALEDNNALLKAEVDKVDAQILSINRKRFAEQSDAAKKIRRLEDKYAALRDKNLRLAALCSALEETLA